MAFARHCYWKCVPPKTENGICFMYENYRVDKNVLWNCSGYIFHKCFGILFTKMYAYCTPSEKYSSSALPSDQSSSANSMNQTWSYVRCHRKPCIPSLNGSKIMAVIHYAKLYLSDLFWCNLSFIHLSIKLLERKFIKFQCDYRATKLYSYACSSGKQCCIFVHNTTLYIHPRPDLKKWLRQFWMPCHRCYHLVEAIAPCHFYNTNFNPQGEATFVYIHIAIALTAIIKGKGFLVLVICTTPTAISKGKQVLFKCKWEASLVCFHLYNPNYYY